MVSVSVFKARGTILADGGWMDGWIGDGWMDTDILLGQRFSIVCLVTVAHIVHWSSLDIALSYGWYYMHKLQFFHALDSSLPLITSKKIGFWFAFVLIRF